MFDAYQAGLKQLQPVVGVVAKLAHEKGVGSREVCCGRWCVVQHVGPGVELNAGVAHEIHESLVHS